MGDLRGLAESVADRMIQVGKKRCAGDEFVCDRKLLVDIVEDLLTEGAIYVKSLPK